MREGFGDGVPGPDGGSVSGPAAGEVEAMGDQSTWTDEQIFAAAYGPLIAKKAAEAEERMRAAQDPYRDLGPLGYKW